MTDMTDRSDFRHVVRSGAKVGVVTAAGVVLFLVLNRYLPEVGPVREWVLALVVLAAAVPIALWPGVLVGARTVEGVAGAAAVGLLGTVAFMVVDIVLLRPFKAYPWTWDAIGGGTHTLISAPTGSGKTLAAFLGVIDLLAKRAADGALRDETEVLYVSPLKALSNDIEKNLRAPLEGIGREFAASMLGEAPIRAAVRTGDTPQSERARMRRQPPHILVTTPESLYILLSTESGRNMLRTVKTVIVDEIHALAGTKRGAHLALSLERLESITAKPPQRIGLSATQRPLSVVAGYLGGRMPPSDDSVAGAPRPVSVVDAGVRKELEVEIVVPVEDMAAVGEVTVTAEAKRPANAGSLHIGGMRVYVPDITDDTAERKRATKELADVERQIASREGKLSNEKFVMNADPELVETERRRLSELKAQKASLAEHLAEHPEQLVMAGWVEAGWADRRIVPGRTRRWLR